MPGTPEDASSKLHTIDERLQEIDQNSAKLAEVLHKLRAMDTSRDGVISREEFLASGGTAEEWQRFESRMDDIEGVSILTGQDLSSVSKQEDLDWFASLIFDQQLSNVPDERLVSAEKTRAVGLTCVGCSFNPRVPGDWWLRVPSALLIT